jgi:hypothetical protein
MSIRFPKWCETRQERSEWARKVALARWANRDAEPRAELPDLVRRITLDDFVSGDRHVFDLHRCGRIDQYRVLVDGREWKSAAGLARILAGIRKAWKRFQHE